MTATVDPTWAPESRANQVEEAAAYLRWLGCGACRVCLHPGCSITSRVFRFRWRGMVAPPTRGESGGRVTMKPHYLKLAERIGLVAAGYFGAAKLGLLFAFGQPQ